MSPAEARLKQVPSDMSEAEWTQRVNLAACYRLVAMFGWDDLVDTHISARVPGPEHHFLINPYGLMFEEITASSLVKVDLDGNQLSKSEYSINPAGFTIHSAIHEVRDDAGCVLHLHTLDGTAVSSCMDGLLPLNQTAQFVTHDLAVVGKVASRVAVMRDGHIVETGPCARLLTTPSQPYTQDLLAAVPTLRTNRALPLATVKSQAASHLYSPNTE